jgi:hypothetical protein
LGQLFACRAIIYFGQFLKKKLEKCPDFCATYFHSKSPLLILTENGLGDILGDFLTKSSGHPEWHQGTAKRIKRNIE